MHKRIGLLLSGCGFLDGSEIQEAVLCLLFLDRAGAEAICLAPDIAQAQTVNHLSLRSASGKHRNVLAESARLARGRVFDLNMVGADELDGVIVPGGYGAVQTLSDFALAGEQSQVRPEVSRLFLEMLKAKKPVGLICIAPALMAKVAQGAGITPRLTIGKDPKTASLLEKMGAEHVESPVTAIVVDKDHKIVSTPAYMLGTRISDVATGIERLVNAVLELS
jgi:enhancing lycopene biosynthesis protein 2